MCSGSGLPPVPPCGVMAATSGPDRMRSVAIDSTASLRAMASLRQCWSRARAPRAEEPRGGTRREAWMIVDEIHLYLMNAWRSEWMNSALLVTIFFFLIPFPFTTPASVAGTKQNPITGGPYPVER